MNGEQVVYGFGYDCECHDYGYRDMGQGASAANMMAVCCACVYSTIVIPVVVEYR